LLKGEYKRAKKLFNRAAKKWKTTTITWKSLK
jgi:hypothetical protein